MDVVTPEGEPSGVVQRRSSVFSKPPGRAVTVQLKSAEVSGDLVWSWWVVVDRHPWSDKQGYSDREVAKAAADAWLEVNYPNRPVVYEGLEP